MLQVRLRKMLTKNIGIMYYKLPQKSDGNSVMFGPILWTTWTASAKTSRS